MKARAVRAWGDGRLPLCLASGHLAFDPALALFQPATVPAHIIGDLQGADLGVEHPALASEGLGIRCNVIIAQAPDFILPYRQCLRQRFGIFRHAEILPFSSIHFPSPS